MSTIMRGTMPANVRTGRKSNIPDRDTLAGMDIARPGADAEYFTVNAVGADGNHRTARAAQSAVWGRAQIAGVALRAVGFVNGAAVAADVPADEIRVFRTA
jgi:hypothetical protein